MIIVACGIQHYPLYCEVLQPFISILYIVCISQNKLTQSTREVTDPTLDSIFSRKNETSSVLPSPSTRVKVLK